jgi:hypothetical protein
LITYIINFMYFSEDSQSTTPAGTNLYNTLIIIAVRPPLLQKEGRVLINEIRFRKSMPDLIFTLSEKYSFYIGTGEIAILFLQDKLQETEAAGFQSTSTCQEKQHPM